MNLTVFLASGATLKFCTVDIITDTTQILQFDYVSEGSGLTKRATFYGQHLAGIAREVVPE